jgi:hypothetical protein
MKKVLFFSFIAVIISVSNINSQGIGKIAPEKPLEVFPSNAWGMDIMFGDAGFGLGTFFRKQINVKWTAFIDASFSETKDDREFEYYDPYQGIFITAFKKNRVFQLPINIGAQYRLFERDLTENLRPYLTAGIGPSFIITTPYEEEFFSSFGNAQTHYAFGGYVGFGANFGLDKSNLVGVSFKYFYSKLIDGGVESLYGKEKTEIKGFFITLTLGLMY